MERKNIFQLIEENYDIVEEIRRINKMYETETFISNKNGVGFLTFNSALSYHFKFWKHNGTCLSIEEFFIKGNAKIDYKIKPNNQQIVNNLEALENMIMLSNEYLPLLDLIIFRRDSFALFRRLVNKLEKYLRLNTKKIDGKIILYPENAPLEQVLNITTDEDAQWELIRYCREDMDLSEKRKSLAYFATVFYIEEDKNDDQATKLVVNKATNILNNLHIRHNNQTGKYEKEYLKDITEDEALSLCDLLYNQILAIILLREQRKYDGIYKSFKDKQKGQKS